MKYNLALFASGSGSNVENIFNYYKGHKSISVSSVLTNNKNAYVLKRAKKLNIESFTFDSNNDESHILSFLLSNNITHIILAGYLKLISPKLIEIYKDKILNIHPSLLPKFGGKGYYGIFVHESVINSNEKYSGITIHLVNKQYDKGKILFQKKIRVNNSDSVESLSNRIHNLEYKFYPLIIEKYILNKLKY